MLKFCGFFHKINIGGERFGVSVMFAFLRIVPRTRACG